MAMDEMKRGRLVMKWSLTILENNDKEDLDLRNSSEMESTLLRKLLGLGKGKEGQVEIGPDVQFCLDLWLMNVFSALTLGPQSVLLTPFYAAQFSYPGLVPLIHCCCHSGSSHQTQAPFAKTITYPSTTKSRQFQDVGSEIPWKANLLSSMVHKTCCHSQDSQQSLSFLNCFTAAF